MVILASLIASQALGEYRVMLGGALNVGVTPVEVKEIIYQAALMSAWRKCLILSTPPMKSWKAGESGCLWKGSPPHRTFSMLASLGGCEPQLKGRVQGGLV